MKQTRKQRTDIEAETRRRTQQVLDNEEFMKGVYESLAEVQKGERGVRLSELKQKRPRARRVPS